MDPIRLATRRKRSAAPLRVLKDADAAGLRADRRTSGQVLFRQTCDGAAKYFPIRWVQSSCRKCQQIEFIFVAAGHIRRIDGFYGCYRGLAPKLIGSIVALVVSERVADKLDLVQPEDNKDDTHLSEEDMYFKFKSSLKRDIVVTVTGIVASHPFHVISLRMMAQFVGRESLYTSIIGSVAEIWKTEGIAGFFAGLVPKLLCDVACLVLTSSTVYILNKYVIKDPLGRQYNAGFTQFFVSTMLYPLQVVSTCSAVSGSRLLAGQPPIMPAYKNWVDCWNDLQARGDLKRGSSLFFRSQAVKSPVVTASFVPLPKLARYQ
ncbi:hypothetical protein KR038_002765 [Drosophila bunnanda]|nr:hypothetical protein KR038_002765 [Drosophila bunnanda]